MRYGLVVVGALGAVIVAVAGCGTTPATPRSSTVPSATVPSAPGRISLPPASGSTAPSPGEGANPSCVPVQERGATVLRGNPAGCAVTVPVGQSLRLELAPLLSAGGAARSYGAPYSSDPSVLQPITSTSPCLTGYTCATFATRTAGSTTIRWGGPSGCVTGGPCVTARLFDLTATAVAP